MWYPYNNHKSESTQEENEEEKKARQIAVECFELRRGWAKEVSDLRMAYEDRDAERVTRIADLEKQIADRSEDVEIAHASNAVWGWGRPSPYDPKPHKVDIDITKLR